MSKMLLTEDLKHGIHSHDDAGSDMGWVPPGYTSSFVHVMLRIPKW